MGGLNVDTAKGLKLEGLDPLVLTGATSVKKRAEALKEFKDPNLNRRVLILSSIGGAGLNLHEARFMIFGVCVCLLCTFLYLTSW